MKKEDPFRWYGTLVIILLMALTLFLAVKFFVYGYEEPMQLNHRRHLTR